MAAQLIRLWWWLDKAEGHESRSSQEGEQGFPAT